MKLLFFMRNTGGVRNFEWTLRLLAERGHEVVIVAEPHSLTGSDDQLERLCRDHATIRHVLPPAVPFSHWSFLGVSLRGAIDYFRYLDDAYADAPKLRRRAERSAPEFAAVAARHPIVGSRTGRRLLRWVFRQAARAVPRDAALDALIAAENPDLVLVTPLVEPGSPQSEIIRSARALGIRAGLCVYSWDNLTNKGLIQQPLDLVTVWNEAMKREAVTLHGVPPEKVVITGAVPYDHWFTWRPRDSREAFCARVGLRPDRPYVLYLCSSKFIAPDEATFVGKWIRELRSASPALRGSGVLVRPHPQNPQDWDGAGLAGLDNLTIWPRAGAVPVDADTRADYFDSIAYSAAVVGVNTSAQIESAIVGRSVLTLLADEFRETQEGTLHFQHLREASGGLLHVAESFAEHAAQLEAALSAGEDDRCRRFVEAFVRPFGRDVSASSRLAAALEEAAARGRLAPDAGPWWAPLVRPVLTRAAARLAVTKRAVRQKQRRRERLKQRRERERTAAAAARVEARRVALEQRDRWKQQVQTQRETLRAAEAEVASRAYAHYVEIRQRLQPMRERNRSVCLTSVEREMLERLSHLWHASPDTIALLRRHCEPVTGVQAAKYDSGSHELRRRLGHERRVLRKQIPRELFLSEPTALGGFGIVKQPDRFNEDTLRFAKALVALHDGAVLNALRGEGPRRLVWEIGGGWGGFAYQFKTVCPNVTYLITGLPETLLLAAVYLQTMFPAARIRYDEGGAGSTLWHDWPQADFIFLPEAAVATMRPPRPELVLDIMAMRHMGEGRVRAHVDKAFELGIPYFYSLLPSDDATAEARAVWAHIEPRYWLHPIPPRVDRVPPVVDLSGAPPLESDSAHLVGWRRLIA